MDFPLNILDLFSKQFSFSCDSNTTFCSCIYHFSHPLMQIRKKWQEWWRVHRHLLLSKRLILLPQGPPPPNPRDHGGCQIALHCTTSNVKPAHTQNKRLCQARVPGSFPERMLWRNMGRFMGTYQAYGHFRKVTILNLGNNKEMPFHTKKASICF